MKCPLPIAMIALSVLAPKPAFAQFISPYCYPIDLNRQAREMYGPTAAAVTVGKHLWDWRAYVNGQYYPLDLNHAVSVQYGPDWSLAAIGVGRYDWVAVKMGALPYSVQPVLEVASDAAEGGRGSVQWQLTECLARSGRFRTVRGGRATLQQRVLSEFRRAECELRRCRICDRPRVGAYLRTGAQLRCLSFESELRQFDRAGRQALERDPAAGGTSPPCWRHLFSLAGC